METPVEKLASLLQVSPGTMENLLKTAVVLAVMLILRAVLRQVVARRIKDATRQYHWQRGITYLVTTSTVLWIVLLWFEESFASFTNFFALIGAGLAIAMHDTVSNLTGWAFILWRRPFQVGDRIAIAGTVGDVIDIRLFEFSVIEVGGDRVGGEQSTGRVIHVPNGRVLRETLANFEFGFRYIWDELPILVTFESDWKKAKELLLTIVNRHAEDGLVGQRCLKAGRPCRPFVAGHPGPAFGTEQKGNFRLGQSATLSVSP